MSFVFGSTLICTDAEAASAITFNKSILLKSITLDGDVYDPSGMLSGGSAPKGGGVLVQVQKIREVERELEGLWATERELEGQLAKAKGVIEKFRKGKRELEIKQHEVGLLEEQVNGSNAAKVRPFSITRMLTSNCQVRDLMGIASSDRRSSPRSTRSKPASSSSRTSSPSRETSRTRQRRTSNGSRRRWTTSRTTRTPS
jgi:structural maintenance of chromosome 2